MDLPAPLPDKSGSPAAAYFAQSYQKFLGACALNSAWPQRCFQMPQGVLRLVFAHSELLPLLTSALEHRVLAEGTPASLTVLCWDCHDSSFGLPPAPWQHDQMGKENHISHYSDGRYQMIYQTVDSSFSMLDEESGLALFCLRDHTRIPYYETASPLRYILNWWTSRQDLCMVHGAAIGVNEQGVLMVGRGGSGKSTTALTCLLSGMDYAGDDYVLAGTAGIPEIHSLYNTAKLSPHSLGMLSRFDTRLETVNGIDQEKAVVFLHKSVPERVRWSFKLKAIILPEITTHPISRLTLVPSVSALRAMAPSTVLQLPGSAPTILKKLGWLAASVPCYSLEIGLDWPSIPDLIQHVIENHPEV